MIKHLACVMDGNRRWAKKFNMATLLGHRNGAEIIAKVIKFCFANDVKHLSLYTFSIENFNRSQEEKDYLFSLIAEKAQELLAEFIEKNIRVRFVGYESLFPVSIRPVIAMVERKTAHLTGLSLNFLFCYGGRQEIVYGVKKTVQDVLDGKMSLDEISEQTLASNLWLSNTPDPELIVFTGRMGVLKRLSNFLLYQSAYSEIYFADCLWPDLSEVHLQDAFDNFAKQQRNFGK